MEPRVKLYMPKEETFLIPMKYIDVTRTTFSSLDVLLEKNIDDYWNVDEDRELSDAWTGFTEVDTRAKRRRKSCVQVATCSDESILSSSIATSSSSASSPIASKRLGMPIASAKPDSRM